jgi:hypothetical protein
MLHIDGSVAILSSTWGLLRGSFDMSLDGRFAPKAVIP